MDQRNGVYIEGKWEKGEGETFLSLNPATNLPLWQGQAASESQVLRAVECGVKAFEKWMKTSVDERIFYLEKYAKILEESKCSLAEVFSKETGKPFWDSLNEVEAMIQKVRISFEAYGKRCGTIIKEQAKGRSITRHKPHGLLAIFGPYNFPGHLPNGHLVPALLAGNSVILKPSELTPLSAETMIRCFEKAGFPKGVVQLLQGGQKIGEWLYQQPKLQGLLFTGSSTTGALLADYFGKFPSKILALEMGGNNPLIIDQVDDIVAAAYYTLQSAYLSSGQRCTCARRLILIDSPQKESFLALLKKMTESILVGAYTDQPEPFMGPLISSFHAEKALQEQALLIEQGAKPLLPMKKMNRGPAFVSPGLLDVTSLKKRADREIFAPLLQLIHVSDFEEALEEANQTQFGLAAGLFSRNEEHYHHFLQHIQAGVVNWNVPLTGASSYAPFGGIKGSGNGRPSAFYAVDYCSYPVASLEKESLELPAMTTPGINLKQENE